MMIKKYLHILACPLCFGNLTLKKNKLECLKCKEKFLIKEDIPILLPKGLEDDLALTQEKWDEEYTDINYTVDIDKQPYVRDSYKHLLKYMPSHTKLFLEVGCGISKNALLLNKNKKIQVVGIDISLNAIKAAKKLFVKNKQEAFFVCGDIRHMPFKEKIFDYMYAPGTIEHFRDTSSAVSDLFRCLKKGGVLTATVPFVSLATPYWMFYGNIPNIIVVKDILEFVHGKIFKGRFQPFGYETSFTKGQLMSLYKKIGFKNIKFGLLETYYEIKITKNTYIKNILRKIATSRLFWPFVFINGQKT